MKALKNSALYIFFCYFINMMLDKVPYPTMRALERFNNNNDNNNNKSNNNDNTNNNNNNNNNKQLYPNVSQIMIYFIDKQPYEQVEPVWKSYCKFYIHSPFFYLFFFVFFFYFTVLHFFFIINHSPSLSIIILNFFLFFYFSCVL